MRNRTSVVPRPPARLVRRSFRWAIVLAAAAIPRTVVGLTVDDLCPPGTDPCVIDHAVTLPPDAVLDFGARALVVTATGALDAGGGSLRLQAESLDVQPHGALLAAGGTITIVTAGDVAIERSADGKTRARIVVAADAGGGEIDLSAGGRLDVSGVLTARGTAPDADGGTLVLTAGGDLVVTAAAGDVTVASGAQGAGGEVSLRSIAGAVVVRHGLDASGGDGDGGGVEVQAARDVELDAIDVRGGGDSGSGGAVRVSAAGDVLLGGAVLGSATGGGNGADVDATAGGTLRVAAPIRVPGAAPDGVGGDVNLAAAVVEVLAPVASSAGDGGMAGDVDVTATADVTLTALVDASGGPDGRAGSVSVDAPGSVTIGTEIAADGDLGSIEIAGGSVLAAAGALHVATAADGLGGIIELRGGCDLQLGPDTSVTAAGGDAENRLTGGHPMRLAGSVAASGRNLLVYDDVPPVITGTVVPPPVTILGPVPSCGASMTVSTTTSTVAATEPGSTTSTDTSTTTSSTVPTACVGDCDDGVGCTRDGCVDGQCVHDEAAGWAGALCRVMEIETTLELPPAGALPHGPLERRLVRRATTAVRLVGTADVRTRSRERLRRVLRQLTVVERLVARHAGAAIEPAFASHVQRLASEAVGRVTLLLDLAD